MRGLAVLLLLLVGQEDPRLAQLIRQLEDDAFDVRDQAQQALIEAGPAAVPVLRKAVEAARASGDRGELLLRAEEALRRIEQAAQTAAVCPEPRRITFTGANLPLRDVLAEISRQAGVRIDAGAVDGAEPVSVALTSAPIFEALDAVCRGHAARSWAHPEEGRFVMSKDPFVERPTSYAGAFRVRLGSLRLTRATDFKDRKAVLYASLEADHDKALKPSKAYDLEVQSATDDRGSTLEIRKGEDDNDIFNAGGRVRLNRAWVRMRPGVVPETSGETFTLRGLDLAARAFGLKGKATFRFALAPTDLRFERPQGGETREAGDFTIKLDLQGGRRWVVSFRRTKGPSGTGFFEELTHRIDAESATAVDEDGAEHRGTLSPTGDTVAANIVIVNGVVQETVDQVTYQFQFPTLKGKAMKELRFRFADRMLEKTVPFAFESVPLP